VSDLAIRPAHNDHLVVGDLLARESTDWAARGRPLFQRLVLDATVAAKQPQLARDAAEAGLPVIVDPMTFLAQSETEPDRGWSALPFGDSRGHEAREFASNSAMDKLVQGVVDFEIANGASWVVPPYFYASDPRDEYFLRGLTAIKATRGFLDATGQSMPIMPVLCGKLDGFASKASWGSGVDWFAHRSKESGADTVGLLMSPVGDFSDTYQKAFKITEVTRRLMGHGLRVHVWRQGALGPLLVAMGAAGYETGLQYGNKTDIRAMASRQRPKLETARGAKGGGEGQMFVPVLGRWILGSQAAALAENPATRALIVCEDATGCCASLSATLSNRRVHAVRSHARRLAELDVMPNSVAWRLQGVSNWSTQALDAITAMNKTLTRVHIPLINPASHAAVRELANRIAAAQLAA
jgi:hypothetical protein